MCAVELPKVASAQHIAEDFMTTPVKRRNSQINQSTPLNTAIDSVASGATKSTPTGNPSSGLNDWINALLILIIVGASALTFVSIWPTLQSTIQSSDTLLQSSKLSWYMVRAAGLTAYTLLGGSTIWGLFLTSRIIADWSPGPMSMLFHASLSWIAVVLSIAHAALLLFDKYYQYAVTDLLVPFIGPYRPFASGLGVIGAWLVLAITISFSMRKLIGQRNWRWLHYLSYGSFALVTVHGLLAGTDSSNLGTQIMYGLMAAAVVGLLIRRMSGAISRPS
jgi:sulfoxide reductase heme-binding subunit YedZ